MIHTLRRQAYSLLVITMTLVGALLAGPVTDAQAAPKQVLVLGDSIVGQSSNYIDFYMDAGGTANTTIKSVGGQAICDLFPGNGGPWTLQSLLAEKRYDAVVVAYSGNSLTKCMEPHRSSGDAVVSKYRADAKTLMGITQQYAVPRVVFVEPMAARDPGLDYVRTKVGMDVYRSMPGLYPTARVIDGGRDVEVYGTWVEWMKCASWDYNQGASGCDAWGNVRIHSTDGVHFYCANPQSAYGVYLPCSTYSAGSNRYGMNLSATRALIGL